MEKVSHPGKHHWDFMLVCSLNTFFIFYRSTWLNDSFDSFLSTEIYNISERKKASEANTILHRIFFCSFYCLLCSPDSVNLSATDSESLLPLETTIALDFTYLQLSVRRSMLFSALL
jgi:hypothetical protein